MDQLGTLQVINYQGPLTLSRDGGNTWEGARVYYESDELGSVAYAFAVAISTKVPGQAYGLILPYAGRRGYVLAQTNDSGGTWHVLYDGFPGDLPLVDPVRSLLYVTCEDGLLCRIDLTSTDFAAKPFAKLPATILAQTLSADGSRHWIATRDGRLYRSLDGGLSWHDLGDAPGVGFWRHLAASRTDSRAFFAVANDGGIWLYREPAVSTAPAQVP